MYIVRKHYSIQYIIVMHIISEVSGTMQSNLPRARRVVVSRPSKFTTSKPSVTTKTQDTVTSRLKDKKPSNLGPTAPNRKAGIKQEDVSLTKAPDKETEPQCVGDEMLVDSDTIENKTDVGDSRLLSPHVSFNDCFKKDPVYLVDDAPRSMYCSYLFVHLLIYLSMSL